MATTEDRLRRYRDKRDFSRTPEPGGEGAVPAPELPEGAGAGGAARFVVQRHRARRLHYDLRLEVDGVLVSFAVPKGPTLDPDVRRLAVRTEDHPMEYADFEGVIPAGEYGGGDVIVWDRGTWTPHDTHDPAAAIAAGELHADLRGDKLRGRFVLIRRGDRDAPGSQWLLLHKHDDDAVAGWDPEDHPRSVRSGRTNDEVADDPEWTWDSDAPADRAERRLHHRSAEDPELAALDELGRGGTWRFAGRDLRLTNLDKVLLPEDPARPDDAPVVTKRDLVRHHARVAPLLVRYLAGRAVNLRRYPDGLSKAGFWHKAAPAHAPDWLTRWRYPDAGRGETQEYLVADSEAAMPWLANFGAVELHPWTSCTAAHDRPTYALFDIDPGEDTTWEEVLVLARLHRTAFEHLGVAAFPKVTGSRGIQVWVPVEPRYTFDQTRDWVEGVSRAVGATVPELVSWEWGRSDRGGRARLDYTQNAVNRTLVAPYSVRARPGGPVSAPITWDELDDPGLRPDRWTVATIAERLDRVGDLFARVLEHRQRLPSLG